MRKKKNIKKSITYRKEYWGKVKETTESGLLKNLEKFESYYVGYAEGLQIAGKITEEQKIDMILRIRAIAGEIKSKEKEDWDVRYNSESKGC